MRSVSTSNNQCTFKVVRSKDYISKDLLLLSCCKISVIPLGDKVTGLANTTGSVPTFTIEEIEFPLEIRENKDGTFLHPSLGLL